MRHHPQGTPDFMRALLPADKPWRLLPLHVDVERLLGGIDLAAPLQRGRPVAQRGVLAESDGGVILLAMAERAAESTLAQLAAALDRGEVRAGCMAERDGCLRRPRCALGLAAPRRAESNFSTAG